MATSMHASKTSANQPSADRYSVLIKRLSQTSRLRQRMVSVQEYVDEPIANQEIQDQHYLALDQEEPQILEDGNLKRH